MAIGLLIAQGLASASCLQALTKDHLVKNDVSLGIVTLVFRAYLSEQSMESLSSTLKKGGVKDVLEFLPVNKRDGKAFDAHFKAEGLPQVAEWFTKRQNAMVKDQLVKTVKEMSDNEDSAEEIVAHIKQVQEESPIPEGELVQSIWQGLMASVDWSARPDQIEGLAIREIGNFSPILEPFCTNAKTQVALINIVQVHCYEDTRIIKTFPQILKVLYNKDCISDQAIIYWAQKGSKAQGRQHFLKATEPLVKFLQEQESEEEEGGEE